MSADNCIAILETTDKFKQSKYDSFIENVGNIKAWRVAHIQAFDNFEYYKEKELHNLGYWMYTCFNNSEIFYNNSEAMKKAKELYEKEYYVEYGIIILNASKFNFPNY